MSKTSHIISVALSMVVVLSFQLSRSAEAASLTPAAAKAILEKNFPKGIRGMCYQVTPTDYFVPAPVKYGNTDFANSDFKALWGTDDKGKTRTIHFPDTTTKAQGDLQTLADMGVNLIRLYGWQGRFNSNNTPWVNHQSFLDECDSLGIKVIVPLTVTDVESTTSINYLDIEWVVSQTCNHSSVVFYSIANEIASSSPVFANITLFAARAREVINQKGTDQLIISPTWPSQEAMGWFTSAGTQIDVWAFNSYDPVQLATLYGWISNKVVNGHPVFISEYGISAFNTDTSTQDESMQATRAPQMVDKIYDNLDSIYGGCWFEYSDERDKGLAVTPCGGQADQTSPASTYVSQVGGSIPTYEGGPNQTVPGASVGTCTYGNMNLGLQPNMCLTEGYFGMSHLRNVGKTALTVLNGKSIGGVTKYWVYRVDDLYLRTVYNTLKDKWNATSADNDVVVDWNGVWGYNDNSVWTRLTPANLGSGRMVVGDLEGSGQDDLIGDWNGTWVHYNNGTWTRLTPASPWSGRMTTGDLDGDGKADLIGDWPPNGTWAYMNDSSWKRITKDSPGTSGLVTGNLDGN